MKGIQGRKTVDAEGMILSSSNSRETRVLQKTVYTAAKTRENSACVTRNHKFLGGYRGNLCVEEI